MKRLFTILALFTIAWTSPAFAQIEVVAAVKNDLVLRQVNLNGPCGAFEITKRVAWTLRAEGKGLLSKPAGNNCQGYSVDYLTRQDGSGIDILGDAGMANIPAWQDSEPPGSLIGRWRAPFDSGDAPTPIPIPTPIPQPIPVPVPDMGLQWQILNELQKHENAEAAERAKAEEFRQAVGHEWQKFGTFLAKYVLPVVGGLLVGKGL